MSAEEQTHGGADVRVERFAYDDQIVTMFLIASMVFGLVAFLVGVIVAFQLVFPSWNMNTPWLTFGRLRPLHTNAAIFAFVGNAMFAGVYYSSQRLLKARLFSDTLSRIHFWGWQAIIAAAAISLPLGFTQGKEYAELEWPIDIAITLIWVVFAINFFGTIFKRRERHLYVALWFYIATIVTVAILHIFNNIWVIAGPMKSYSVYAGVQDAFMQWWYGHNAVAFFLTTPYLGLMYYFMPKAAERPVYSYRLSILHFWSLIFIYIWAGPHHLHYTALPAWASTLGMLFSVMLWMPSWGGMINGLLTLRGAWRKVSEDPILKFMVVAVTFYGMSTFEGPLLSIKAVNGLAHYTDWIIAHVHSGTLGWNGFLTFGIMYWMWPRLMKREMYNKGWVNLHFWMATIGILLYIVSMYVSGVTQGLMWRQFDVATGQLAYGDFVMTVEQIIPMYIVRGIGGTLYLVGMILGMANWFMTWKLRDKKAMAEVEWHEAPPLQAGFEDPVAPPTPLEKEGAVVADYAIGIQRFTSLFWHRTWERKPFKFTVWVLIAVGVASLFEIIPTFAIRSNVPTIQAVKPYTPLELAGRDIYIREGCYNCHSQMIRPMRSETQRYGEYSKPGEFVYDHPFQWGSRRIGPDLHRVGGKYDHSWHYRHMRNPREMKKKSRMPSYPWLLQKKTNWSQLGRSIKAMVRLGVPYDNKTRLNGVKMAKAQALKIAKELAGQLPALQGAKNSAKKDKFVKYHKDREIIALIAYLQRLGTDIKGKK